MSTSETEERRAQRQSLERREAERRKHEAAMRARQDAAIGPQERADVQETRVKDVDLRQMVHWVQQAKRFLELFNKLQKFQADDMTAGEIQNGVFETGRSKLNIARNLLRDTSNVFTRPCKDPLIALDFKAESFAVATAEDLAAITAKFEQLGGPTERLAPLCWSIARYCADTSSSYVADPKGTFEYPGGAITRDAVYAVIQEVTTLRAFCRAFAPVVWNEMLITKRPPAGWQTKGYTASTKYAAFDPFDYVLNSACVQPLEGIIRVPTDEETIAHMTNKRITIDRNRRNGRFSSTNSLVTGGMFGKDIKTNFNGSNNAD
uniref:Capsid protein n=1 Tax=Garlic common latent virus TaxID=47900 RepID=W5ZVQ0_9VIRU|nr:coat protein [Garlic common latent virus]